MFLFKNRLVIFMITSAQLFSLESSFAADLPDANIKKIASTQPVNSSEKASQGIKEQLIEKLAKIKFFSAGFTQKIIDEKGNVLQQGAGKLAVSKPNLVYWNTQTPDESLIVSDGKTLWVYDPFIEQATAYKLASSIANTPILLLTSNAQELWEHYSVSQINPATYLIHTNDKNSQIKTLELHFNKEQLSGFTFLDATGQLSVISLNNTDFVSAPAADLFQFFLPKGSYLDDQR